MCGLGTHVSLCKRRALRELISLHLTLLTSFAFFKLAGSSTWRTSNNLVTPHPQEAIRNSSDNEPLAVRSGRCDPSSSVTVGWKLACALGRPLEKANGGLGPAWANRGASRTSVANLCAGYALQDRICHQERCSRAQTGTGAGALGKGRDEAVWRCASDGLPENDEDVHVIV